MRRSQTLGWEKRRDAPTRCLRVQGMSPAPDSRGRTDGGRRTPAHFIANRSSFDLGRNASWPPSNALGKTSRKAHRRASVARRACILHLNLKDCRHAACPANGRLPLSVGASRAPKRARVQRSPTLASACPPPHTPAFPQTSTGLPQGDSPRSRLNGLVRKKSRAKGGVNASSMDFPKCSGETLRWAPNKLSCSPGNIQRRRRRIGLRGRRLLPADSQTPPGKQGSPGVACRFAPSPHGKPIGCALIDGCHFQPKCQKI